MNKLKQKESKRKKQPKQQAMHRSAQLALGWEWKLVKAGATYNGNYYFF